MGETIPTADALRTLATSPDTVPVVMVKPLKFTPDGGRESYLHYMEVMEPLKVQYGLRIVYSGRFAGLLVGSDTWDAILLVEYPSRRALLEMIASPGYQAVRGNREAGLDRTVL
jgi:uncharacterized protein (DUF1330 family)